MSPLWPLLVAMLYWMTQATVGDNNPGTTPNIQSIFMGRCYDYELVKYKTLMPLPPATCENLWIEFSASFSYMPPCDVTMNHYDAYMQAASQPVPVNKTMFWSGVKELVHEYAEAGQRYVTLEDTLIGYLADGLVWCGQGNPPGMNYSRCPSWTDCPFEASESFWAHASKTFALAASGQVTVMLDGSSTDRPAYRRDSFFGKYELPYLKKDIVTEVRVLLVHALDTPMSETCLNGSLELLKEDVLNQGFQFSCLDDSLAILHLLCVDEPADRECKLASAHMTDSGHITTSSRNQSLVISSKLNRFAELPAMVGIGK